MIFRILLYPYLYSNFDALGISQEMYHAAVRDGAKIDWQCPRFTDIHSVLFAAHESHYEEQEQQPGLDVSHPITESTRIETDKSNCDVPGMLPSLKVL